MGRKERIKITYKIEQKNVKFAYKIEQK